MKIIFMNGPPGTGKSTAVFALTCALENVHVYAMKTPIVTVLKALHGVSDADWSKLDAHPDKDRPAPALLGFTPRQAQIDLFSKYLEPVYGSDVLGRLAVRVLRQSTQRYAVVDGVGRIPEVLPIVQHFHRSQCLMLRFYREGCTYDGDIRRYIPTDLMHTVEVINRFDKDMFKKYVAHKVFQWLKHKR